MLLFNAKLALDVLQKAQVTSLSSLGCGESPPRLPLLWRATQLCKTQQAQGKASACLHDCVAGQAVLQLRRGRALWQAASEERLLRRGAVSVAAAVAIAGVAGEVASTSPH